MNPGVKNCRCLGSSCGRWSGPMSVGGGHLVQKGRATASDICFVCTVLALNPEPSIPGRHSTTELQHQPGWFWTLCQDAEELGFHQSWHEPDPRTWAWLRQGKSPQSSPSRLCWSLPGLPKKLSLVTGFSTLQATQLILLLPAPVAPA